MGQSTANFSLGGILNWNVNSIEDIWLKRNIEEFRSSYCDKRSENLDFTVVQVQKIEVPETAVKTVQNMHSLSDSVFIKDKSSEKRASIQIHTNGYRFLVEKGFTFHYYAALLDAFIKLFAFNKDIVALHASAMRKDDKVSVFAAWRRIGKTTLVLNALYQNNDLNILADDALMITNQGTIIAYLRGIDLFPYLPIPNQYLSFKNKSKRRLFKIFKKLMPLPTKLKSRILNRFFLVRINLASFGHGLFSKPIKIDKAYALKKHSGANSEIKTVSHDYLKKFVGESSYNEISEYQDLFSKVCSVFPDSPFEQFVISYDEFQEKIDAALNNMVSLELLMSENYDDIQSLSRRL